MPTKVHLVKAMVSPVVMYGCESWTIKKAEQWRIDGFELWYWRSLLRVPWTAKRSSQSILKRSQSWIFTGRTDAEAEAPIFWPPDAKNWLLRKDPDAGKDWGQEEKGMTEDEMVGWHHQLDGHELEQVSGVGYGQGSLQPMGSQSETWLSDWTELKVPWSVGKLKHVLLFCFFFTKRLCQLILRNTAYWNFTKSFVNLCILHTQY